MADEKRPIDANALMEKYCEGCAKEVQEMCKSDPVCATMMWVVEEPTVYAVEVVRCKDCKQYNEHRYCNYFAQTVLDNDFCSYGERKDNA